MSKVKHVLGGEMAEIVKDCNDEESRIIADTVKALKDSLRRNSSK